MAGRRAETTGAQNAPYGPLADLVTEPQQLAMHSPDSPAGGSPAPSG